MSECGAIEFLKYGTISESDIVSSRIATSTITGSTIESSHITQLASLDAASAQRIADAIAALPTAQLTALAAAIAKALPAASLGQPPIETENPELPTAVLGNRAKLLGQPNSWLQYKDFVVPAYRGK